MNRVENPNGMARAAFSFWSRADREVLVSSPCVTRVKEAVSRTFLRTHRQELDSPCSGAGCTDSHPSSAFPSQQEQADVIMGTAALDKEERSLEACVALLLQNTPRNQETNMVENWVWHIASNIPLEKRQPLCQLVLKFSAELSVEERAAFLEAISFLDDKEVDALVSLGDDRQFLAFASRLLEGARGGWCNFSDHAAILGMLARMPRARRGVVVDQMISLMGGANAERVWERRELLSVVKRLDQKSPLQRAKILTAAAPLLSRIEHAARRAELLRAVMELPNERMQLIAKKAQVALEEQEGPDECLSDYALRLLQHFDFMTAPTRS